MLRTLGDLVTDNMNDLGIAVLPKTNAPTAEGRERRAEMEIMVKTATCAKGSQRLIALGRHSTKLVVVLLC